MQKDMKLSKTFDSFVIPFHHSSMYLKSDDMEKDFEDLIENLTSKHYWKKDELNFNTNLFTHVTSILAKKDDEIDSSLFTKVKGKLTKTEADIDSSICTYLTLEVDNKVRDSYGLSTKGYSLMNGDTSISDIKFDEIGMFLFKSGIGFIVIDLKFGSNPDIQSVIDTNFYIKRLLNKKVTLKSHYKSYRVDGKKVSIVDEDTSLNDFKEAAVLPFDKSWLVMDIPDPKLKTEQFEVCIEEKEGKNGDLIKTAKLYGQKTTMADIIIRLLKGIETSQFFGSVSSADGESKPVHCLPYTVAIAQKGEEWNDEEVGKNLYQLRHGFNNSHKPTMKSKSLDNREVERVFENSIWGVSKEGYANIVIPTEDDRNFFEGSYLGSVKKEYRFLYILGLHQYFGLVGFANELSSLPSDTTNYNRDSMYKLEMLTMRMGFFYLKSIFNEVSFLSHQQEVYERIMDVLAISDLLGELKHESDNILMIIQNYQGAIQETRIKRFSWIGSVFAVLAIIQSVWELVDSYFSAKAFNEAFVLVSPNTDFYVVMLLLVGSTGLLVMAVVGLKSLIEKFLSNTIKRL